MLGVLELVILEESEALDVRGSADVDSWGVSAEDLDLDDLEELEGLDLGALGALD